MVSQSSKHLRFSITDIFTLGLFDWEGQGMKTNRFNDKVVKREEWTTSQTVTITYTDGKKETMSRATFNQIIREVK